VGPWAAVSWTLKSLIAVPFQTPTVPGVDPDAEPTTISLAKMKPHRRDSYHPRDSGDHSNRWTRIGDASESRAWIRGSSAKDGSSEIKVRASGSRDDCRAEAGIRGEMIDMSVRIVWRGSSGTHVSIQPVVGTNPLEVAGTVAA